jgi:hypothetical protein
LVLSTILPLSPPSLGKEGDAGKEEEEIRGYAFSVYERKTRG